LSAGGPQAKARAAAAQQAASAVSIAPRLELTPGPIVPTASGELSDQEPVPESAKPPKRPSIRSFDYKVAPYVALRTTLAEQGEISTKAPPPPTILSLLPEGSPVRAGDIVCELDSSGFRQALEIQQLRFLRARSWVDQAGYLLDASEVALREYQHGILPQDIL